MSEKNTRTIVFQLDRDNPPTLTSEERKALEDMPDEAIDYSDIPAIEGRRWVGAGTAPAGRGKEQITVSLDADIVEFFRSADSYESRMNSVLRRYVESQRKAS